MPDRLRQEQVDDTDQTLSGFYKEYWPRFNWYIGRVWAVTQHADILDAAVILKWVNLWAHLTPQLSVGFLFWLRLCLYSDSMQQKTLLLFKVCVSQVPQETKAKRGLKTPSVAAGVSFWQTWAKKRHCSHLFLLILPAAKQMVLL